MRVFRKTDYSRGVGVRKTTKNRKLSLPELSGMTTYFAHSRFKFITGFISLIIITTLISTALFTQHNAAAETTVNAGDSNQLSPTQEAESYALYRVIGTCLKDGKLKDSTWIGSQDDHLEVSNAKSGNWFADDSDGAFGGYLDGIDGIKILNLQSKTGAIGCNQPALTNAAMKLWNWSYDDMLCSIGLKRQSANEGTTRCTEKQGGTSAFNIGDTSKYGPAVQAHVYGGQTPSLSDAAKYVFYLRTFQKICAPNATITTTKPSGALGSTEYAVQQVSGTGDDLKTATTYYLGDDNKNGGDSANIISASSFYSTAVDTLTCNQLVSNIKNNADAYAAYIKTNGTDEGADNSAGDDNNSVSTCTIEGVGWLICPVARWMAGVADGFYDWIASLFLETHTSLVSREPGSDGAYKAWQSILVIANTIFVIVFLFIIFSQATGYGISNYGVKKMLPKIIIGAILINISFFLCQALIDLSNLLGYGIADLLNQSGDKTISWNSIIGQILSLGTSAAVTVGTGVAVTASLLTGVGVAGVLIAVVSLLFIFLFLIARQVLIVICVVIAPIAFAAWLLPNTEKFFKYWWKIFYAMLIVFPLTSLVMGGSALAADVIRKAISGV